MILNCLNPKFSKKFVIDYYFEMVQRLKFCVYDIDNNTYDLADDDFLGELECTLGQVSVTVHSFEDKRSNTLSSFCASCLQIVSSRQITRSLLLKDKRPAGRGTITVSGLLLSHFKKIRINGGTLFVGMSHDTSVSGVVFITGLLDLLITHHDYSLTLETFIYLLDRI